MPRPLIIFLTLLVGCSSGPPRQLTWEDLAKGKELHGQSVILEGYPGVLNHTADHQGKQSFVVMDQAVGVSSSAQRSAICTASEGTGPNQVEKLPEEYTSKDLKVHCADGTVVGTKDKVRVQGKAEFVYGLTILVDRIEKI